MRNSIESNAVGSVSEKLDRVDLAEIHMSGVVRGVQHDPLSGGRNWKLERREGSIPHGPVSPDPPLSGWAVYQYKDPNRFRIWS